MRTKTRKGQIAYEFLMNYGWAILVVIAAIGALAYFGVLPEQEQANNTNSISSDSNFQERVATCLDQTGAKMYGADWCSHCNNQKKEFGDAFEIIDYIDCESNKAVNRLI
jgi:hypothetical protein